MRFFARIKAGSAVEAIWRKRHRISGVIAGVEFRLMGSEFVSGEIEPAHVAELEPNISIEIAVMTNPSADVLEALEEVVVDTDVEPRTTEPGQAPRRGRR